MPHTFAKKYTLRQLAEITGSQLIGDPDYLITGVESLESASSEDVSFLANLRYKELLGPSCAGVVCISPSIEPIPGKNYLVHENPSTTFQTLIELFLLDEYNKSGFLGIHETAIIHPTAKLGSQVQIGPYVTIDQGAVIGDRTRILSHVSIGSGARIGSDCVLYSHVVIREKCILKNRVIIQPGAVIGSCGFGFATDAKGVHTKLDQLGIVEIEDDVEIGANTTVDRARFKTTKICQGSKIDNLVQVGHNVQIGPYNLIVAQTGISGSAKTGRNVILGGQAGIVGHLEIASGTLISARGGVSKTISKPGKYSGTPVLPLEQHNRQQVHLRRISEYVKRIEELEKRLSLLESNKPSN
jgi:UDP-3-O-[3-hydroxymyristoyl] glucosamine N-acyltransferase